MNTEIPQSPLLLFWIESGARSNFYIFIVTQGAAAFEFSTQIRRELRCYR